MHFFYLDEAGCTGADLNNGEQPVFVLGGISVRDEGWNATQESYSRILNEYFGGQVPEGFELHSEQLLSPNGNGPFVGHDRERRSNFAKSLLELLNNRSHDVHYFAIDKAKLNANICEVEMPYNTATPYLVAYDCLITQINWFVKDRLGRSARGMFIIDEKRQFHDVIERITNARRFEVPATHRVKWIVEFSYPIDSYKNPMIQLSDLVVFCTKKFLEIEGGYREAYPPEAKRFFAECYSIIDSRVAKKTLVERDGRNMDRYNSFLGIVQAKPSARWKRKYGL